MYRGIRFVLAAMFIAAGIIKLQRPEVFAETIDAFGLAPRFFIGFLALGIPILEILAGIGLLFDIRGSLAVITGLTVMFIIVLAYAIWLGLDIDCGCYGPSDPESQAFGSLRSSLHRDLAMAAGILYLYLWRRFNAFKPYSPMVRLKSLINHREIQKGE